MGAEGDVLHVKAQRGPVQHAAVISLPVDAVVHVPRRHHGREALTVARGRHQGGHRV